LSNILIIECVNEWECIIDFEPLKNDRHNSNIIKIIRHNMKMTKQNEYIWSKYTEWYYSVSNRTPLLLNQHLPTHICAYTYMHSHSWGLIHQENARANACMLTLTHMQTMTQTHMRKHIYMSCTQDKVFRFFIIENNQIIFYVSFSSNELSRDWVHVETFVFHFLRTGC